MKDLLLSPHFKFSEFERSATATSTGSTSHAEPTSGRAFSIAIAYAVIFSMTAPDPL